MRLLYPSVLHMYRKKRASRESNSVNVIKKTQAKTHERCHALPFVYANKSKSSSTTTTNNLDAILLLTIRVSPVFLKAIFQNALV